MESRFFKSMADFEGANTGLTCPDQWKSVYENPADLLKSVLKFDDLDPQSVERLNDLVGNIKYAGLYYESAIEDERDADLKLMFMFNCDGNQTAVRFATPSTDTPKIDSVQWQLPEAYLGLLGRSNGAEWFSYDIADENDGTLTLDESQHHFIGSTIEVPDFVEMLHGEDFLQDIFEDPDAYGFTEEHLTLNAKGKHVAFCMVENNSFYCFHEDYNGKDGNPAVLPWMSDAEGGFDESFRNASSQQEGFGWWIILALWAFAKNEDYFGLMVGEV